MPRSGMRKSRGSTVSSSDVARLAGVSRASVSRSFFQDQQIAPETRQRVLDAAQQLGYQPNAIARSLMTGKTGIVGIVIAGLLNPFHAAVLDALCQNLQRRGLAALVLAASEAEETDALIPKLLSYRVDGVLIASSVLSSQIVSQCIQAKRRVVLVNRDEDLPRVSSVCCDNYLGGTIAATHLLEMKYRRLAFLAGSDTTLGSRRRAEGFADCLAAGGRKIHAQDVGNYDYGEASAAARRLLSQSPRPDAIFCANDIMAFAVLDIARREFGLSIPRDLGVVGFDNTPLSAASAYDLTSVDQQIASMTSTAVDLLLSKNDSNDRVVILSKCNLEIRGSSSRR